MRLFTFSFIVSVSFLSCFSPGKSHQHNSGLKNIFENIQEFERSNNPFDQISNGKHPVDFPQYTETDLQDQLKAYQQFLKNLEAIPDNNLSRQEQISKAVMHLKLGDLISNIQFNNHLIPFNAEGGFFNELTYYFSNLPFETKADYDAYINWLPKYATFIRQNQALMQEGVKKRVVAPKVIVKNVVDQIKPWASDDFKVNPLASPFSALANKSLISEKDRAALLKSGANELRTTVIPAYKELLDFSENQYLSAAYDAVGISEVPEGKSYYEDRIRFYSTLDITPDSVFNLGLQEVARIRVQMSAIITSLNFDGDFADFVAFLRSDEQFYASSPEQLLHYAAWLSKKAEGALPRYFINLYSLPFTVEPVPDDIAPTYTGGRYVHGIEEQKRPGTYWVNTFNLPSRKFYTLPALTLHEAVPGHHLQIMRAAKLDKDDVPQFRNAYYISAFGEGWALYGEYLGEEMGMYPTPYDMFGRYTYEMWRACRLVVDVGLHYKGWTRDQAITYLSENTALSAHEISTEIDRYIGWPGQAVSYKIGEIMIKKLRKEAEAALGGKFDIREFHEAVLKNGSVPLSVLVAEVNAFIQKEKTRKG